MNIVLVDSTIDAYVDDSFWIISAKDNRRTPMLYNTIIADSFKAELSTCKCITSKVLGKYKFNATTLHAEKREFANNVHLLRQYVKVYG